MLQQSITFTSPSKSMGFPALRTSVCLGPEEFIKEFSKLGGYSLIDQKTIAAALANTPENKEYLEEVRQKYLANINLVKERLASLNEKFRAHFSEDKDFAKPFIADPEAGNIYLLDFSGLKGKIHNDKVMDSGLDVAKWLLDDALVATVPGECSMFDKSEMLVRIALGHPPREISQAFDLIEQSITKIQNASRSPSAATAQGIKSEMVASKKDSATAL